MSGVTGSGPEVFGSSGGRILPVGKSVTVEVPASSANLGPGFDALGVALGLYDSITVTIIESGLELEVTGEGAGEVPEDASHLVAKAVEAGLRAGGVGAPGVRIACHNAIPHSRGLGSSASAAVGGLVAANGLMDSVLTTDHLVQLSSEFEGHPDNAAASVLGGVVVSWTERSATGVTYRAVRMDVDPSIVATVLVPSETSSTAQTRGLLPASVPHEDAAFNASRAALMSVALGSRPEFLPAATEDRLHQSYRAPALKATTRWITRLRERGLAATVSGAGPTVLVLGTSRLPDDLRDLAESEGWRALDLQIADGAQVVSTD
ncbi:homoserine kinase [Dietzia aerolata]|uniref:Homoserine kinase n=1 Tax=Dietzia aerolata TaxID=595984 RepID=A0ABV5JQP0_9ACTN|nr:homoserine kinase [Dietzia aerolata]MBB0968718.1 homoserine kinase [Dietzia aerolata]HIW67998.1 homoserine kinase [Candidatus Dietzia merdigallinarum]